MKVEIIGMIAGLFTTCCFLPQVWKTVRTKETKGISLLYFISLNIGIVLWVAYGFYKCDKAIILANFFSLIFAFTILCYKIRNVFLGEDRI